MCIVMFITGILISLSPAHSANASTEIDCLARNIYFEARGEGYDGMLAVAWVTLNRKQDSSFPKTVCGVVYDKKNSVQFSWTVAKVAAPHGVDWQEARRIAKAVYSGATPRSGIWENKDILFYHASRVKAKARRWFEDNLEKVTQVGDHIFYADN